MGASEFPTKSDREEEIQVIPDVFLSNKKTFEKLFYVMYKMIYIKNFSRKIIEILRRLCEQIKVSIFL